MTTVSKSYAYASGFWVSLDKDQQALDHLCDVLVFHIVRNSALKLASIIFHYNEGKNPDGSDDDEGFLVVVGRGVNKKLRSRLTDEQIVEVKKAMDEVLKHPVADKPQWFRLQRIRNRFFEFGATGLSTADLTSQIQRIIDTAGAEPAAHPARKHLGKNPKSAEALKRIESAIVVVALDDTKPVTREDASWGCCRCVWMYNETRAIEPVFSREHEEACHTVKPDLPSYLDEVKAALSIGTIEAQDKLKLSLPTSDYSAVFQDACTARVLQGTTPPSAGLSRYISSA
ncbi:Carnitine O-acetyltransferase mitochondrial [Ceratobasidium sp. 414]|nr:Carnitine O-acetyltransferase mitochondrial [Ceratobasidium sp. 414]